MYLSPRSNRAKGKKNEGDEFIGEYQSLMEQEFYDFVLFEVPWIVNWVANSFSDHAPDM